MSDNLKKYSFRDLLNQGKIRIPKIQRDYVQGRNVQSVNEIRKVFIHTLLLVVKGKRPATELDFVYGSDRKNAFEPLDGQQRLTTLFLLYWMLGESLYLSEDNKKQSGFTYETRNTSSEFCDELVRHDAILFVQEAMRNKESNKSIKDSKDKKAEFPSLIMRGRDWFKWEWKFDPTINSMLVMIDSIYEEMGVSWSTDLCDCRQNLNHITFNLLNLGEFGLSDELFIKMNARGKQLSDFDKLKSTLEEELQIQQKENIASEQDEETWRTLMDGAWIDFFWHKYARKKIIEAESYDDATKESAKLQAAKISEIQFKKLLLRLIALQMFEDNRTCDGLMATAYNLNDDIIDNLLFEYSNSLTELRSDETHVVPASTFILNFKRLIEDMNLLIYKDGNETYYEISYLLPEICHIDKNEWSLFDSFLDTNVANDVELTFYAMLLFLRSFPMKKQKDSEEEKIAWYFKKEEHDAWLKNLEDWVRSTRNILLNNNNNQRIDKIELSKGATQSLKQIVADLKVYVEDHGLDVETDNTIVRQFLISSDKTYQGLDNQSLTEERLKAKLSLEPDGNAWKDEMDIAEQHPYLWGQIRCLLNWSNNQIDKFKNYSTKLIQLLDLIQNDNQTYYAALLAFVPNCWEEDARLYLLNKDRDNSIKRYLRNKAKESQTYGINIKNLIDKWIESYASLSAKDFLEKLKESKRDESEPWIQCIIRDPHILDVAFQKRIFYNQQNKHVILAQHKTEGSHCYDPILVYLNNLCKSVHLNDKEYKLFDSKSDYDHAFWLEKNSHQYFVKWSEEDEHYSINVDDNIDASDYTAEDMINFMENIITQVTSTE